MRDNDDQEFCIQRLERRGQQQQQHSTSKSGQNTVYLNEQVVCFRKPQEHPSTEWSFALPTCSSGTLYMFPNWYNTNDKPLHAYKFDFKTGLCGKINLPQSQSNGYAVNLGERIYILDLLAHSAMSVFECYDPTLATWTTLKPFPHTSSGCRVNATAVLDDDTILFWIAYLSSSSSPFWRCVDSRHIWAYNVLKDKWYVVDVVDSVDVDDDDVDVEDDGVDPCFCIIGATVVLNGTIYALTDLQYDLVLALSIEKEHKDDGNLVFRCSLKSKILVKGFEPVLSAEKVRFRNMHLVYLDDYKFCIVDSCEPVYCQAKQPIQVSYINLVGKNMIRVDGWVYELQGQGMDRFYAVHCFPLPKGMTTALEGKEFVFDLDPFTSKQDKADGEGVLLASTISFTSSQDKADGEGVLLASTNSFMSEQDNADGEGVLASTNSLTSKQEKAVGEGHSVYLRKLPRYATAKDVEMLKKYGPIKKE